MDEDRTVAMSCRKKRRIPVGKAVYPVLRRGDYVYVDKTGFISLLETFDGGVRDKRGLLTGTPYLTQAAGTPAAVEAKLDDACRQSAAYASAGNVRTLPNLKKLAVVFAGPAVNGVRYL